MIPYLNERHIVSRVHIAKMSFDYPDRESGFIPEFNNVASSQNSIKLRSRGHKNVKLKTEKSQMKQTANLFGQTRAVGRTKKGPGVRLIEGKFAHSNGILTLAEIERKKVSVCVTTNKSEWKRKKS